MQREVTPRVAGLIQQAIDLLDQALYEGSHVRRQEPEPREFSPWSRPDLPSDVLVGVQLAAHDLGILLFDHFDGDPVDALLEAK